ncbi:MAG: hypothetical protein NTV05_10145 [Acidobacteria bacterium]|nr:hypothetical protein [Acidobacteriota bacterium]
MTHPLRQRAASLFVIGLLVLAPIEVAAGQRLPAPLSAADADRFDKKLVEITNYGVRTSSGRFRPAAARRTVVTEAETNAYIRLKIASTLPAGMVDPYVTALGGGRVSATATLDLDAVRRSEARGGLELSQLLTGRLPVSVTGVLRTRAGIATFDMESASIAGIPIPKGLLQQLVSYYTRSAEHPGGVGLDAQFVLPVGIREIDVQTHQAVIVQ